MLPLGLGYVLKLLDQHFKVGVQTLQRQEHKKISAPSVIVSYLQSQPKNIKYSIYQPFSYIIVKREDSCFPDLVKQDLI